MPGYAPAGPTYPAAWGTWLCSHVQPRSWTVDMLTWKDRKGCGSMADKNLPCVCYRLQLPLNAITQREVSFAVEFDFNNLII